MGTRHADTVCEVCKFHFPSTHSMINADHELFQLNTVKEHDNHEVI